MRIILLMNFCPDRCNIVVKDCHISTMIRRINMLTKKFSLVIPRVAKNLLAAVNQPTAKADSSLRSE